MMSHGLTELAITSYDVNASQPFFFKRRYPLADEVWDCEMWKAARSTSAAPTYFPPFQLPAFQTRPPQPADAPHELVDGGVFANSPAVCAHVEALELWGWETDMVVCSIGTGNKHMRAHEGAGDWGLLAWLPAILDTVFDGVADAVDYQMARICRHEDNVQRYFRFQVAIPDSMSAAMDDARPEQIQALIQLGNTLVADNSAALDNLCKLLGERDQAPWHPEPKSPPQISHPPSSPSVPVS